MALKYSSKNTLGWLVKEMESKFVKKTDVQAPPEYSFTKQQTAESGFFATYQLTKDGTPVGEKLNIPKDYLVKSGTIETCQEDNNPIQGLKVGNPYIKMIINTKDNSGTDEPLYIPAHDLVDVYTEGNGISVTGNSIAIKIDTANANGLSVGANGLSLGIVSESSNGAMTSAMLTKLNGAVQTTDLEEITEDEVKALFTA